MGFKWISGGYVGVDVFFVISGFLITSILKKELEGGFFSFREFWGRRIRRILPAMIVVTAVTLTATYFFVFPLDRVPIGTQAASALLSFANFYFWLNTGDYWGSKAEESPFLHTWSLSVEEQFYLGFPVVMWLLFRFRPQWVRGVILFVLVLSLSLFLYGSVAHPVSTFYLLPTRAWELATGSYLAVTLPGRKGQSGGAANVESYGSLALTGFWMVIACYFFLPILNGGLAVAVLGTALVIAFAQSGMCKTILAQPSIVHVGKISYSLYLWHWPVLVFANRLGFPWHKGLLFIPIYLLSLASYYLVEKPTRRLKGMIPAIAGCYALALGFSAVFVFQSPFYDTSDFEKPHYYGLFYDLSPENEFLGAFKQVVVGVDVPQREASPEAYKNGGIIVGQGESYPKVVVLGDSHGIMWSDSIRAITETLGIKTAFISMGGVSPFFQVPVRHDQKLFRMTAEEKYAYDDSRLELIKKWHPDLVIVCNKWNRDHDEDPTDLLQFLEKHASRILLLEQPPELAYVGNRNALQYAIFRGIKPEVGVKKYFPILNPDMAKERRELLHTLVKKYKNCDYVPIYDLYEKDSQALLLDGKNIVYFDDDHLTTYGARLALPRIESKIKQAISAAHKNR
jgi:peptidoglycan/LPS O-acetylase OafA/YrhL